MCIHTKTKARVFCTLFNEMLTAKNGSNFLFLFSQIRRPLTKWRRRPISSTSLESYAAWNEISSVTRLLAPPKKGRCSSSLLLTTVVPATHCPEQRCCETADTTHKTSYRCEKILSTISDISVGMTRIHNSFASRC